MQGDFLLPKNPPSHLTYDYGNNLKQTILALALGFSMLNIILTTGGVAKMSQVMHVQGVVTTIPVATGIKI